jgi:hypothetical protein
MNFSVNWWRWIKGKRKVQSSLTIRHHESTKSSFCRYDWSFDWHHRDKRNLRILQFAHFSLYSCHLIFLFVSLRVKCRRTQELEPTSTQKLSSFFSKTKEDQTLTIIKYFMTLSDFGDEFFCLISQFKWNENSSCREMCNCITTGKL